MVMTSLFWRPRLEGSDCQSTEHPSPPRLAALHRCSWQQIAQGTWRVMLASKSSFQLVLQCGPNLRWLMCRRELFCLTSLASTFSAMA